MRIYRAQYFHNHFSVQQIPELYKVRTEGLQQTTSGLQLSDKVSFNLLYSSEKHSSLLTYIKD